ncbi:uncharacterized protein LOC125770578 [Anopheles funestus]|uniref:uncharacterized protein LOC125770578 n=1 Tax=Anopheles funestus TaxID=62324 RepID=UPI0020C6B96B|nr:uncharacterized protein LOC125770578 [Anopheles funestus]XP_049296264.1 uncharacterized protein LOC125770578 [Anopheles funestus]
MYSPVMSKPCCKNPKNLFCFVCGLYILSHHKRSIMTRPLLEAYEAHFKVRTSKENYLQGPPSVCNICNNALLRWKNGMCPKPELPFAIPMLWSAPSDHETDCYFCLTRTAPLTDKNNARLVQAPVPVEYPVLRSAVRPKLFAARPIVASQPPQSRAPVTVVKEKDDSSVNLMRTYPGQIKIREPANVMQVVRRSLPVQNIVSNVQTNPTVVSTSTLKRKVDPGVCLTYGLTKVRLRNSEPTIVLEKCKKLLPSNPSAIISRPATSSNLNAPRILNVFSLNKDAANCETSPPNSPVEDPPHPAIKIEVVEDEEEPIPNKLMKIQSIDGELGKAETKQQEKEPTITQPAVTKQITALKVIKIEPRTSSPTEHKLLPIRPVRCYNAKDLSSASKGEQMTIKITPSMIAKQSADIAASLKAATVATTQPNNATLEQQQKTPKVTPAKYCFINMKDLPSSSASSNEKTIKIITPVIAQQLADTDQTSLNVTPAAAAAAATVSPGSKVTLEQDDTPHRITQSELILLLRELELPKEKSAILIDRLKRWNLLAIEMVGTNRVRSLESTPPQQPIPGTPVSPASSSSSSSTPPPTPLAQDQQSAEGVNALTNMKDIQIRNTRAANRQSAPPIIISSVANRTKVSTVSKPDPPALVVAKSESTSQQRRHTTVAVAGKETATLPQRGSITTRSAANAMVKRNVTIPKVK